MSEFRQTGLEETTFEEVSMFLERDESKVEILDGMKESCLIELN